MLNLQTDFGTQPDQQQGKNMKVSGTLVQGPTKPRSEVFVENLIANLIENGRKSRKFTIKFYGQAGQKCIAEIGPNYLRRDGAIKPALQTRRVGLEVTGRVLAVRESEQVNPMHQVAGRLKPVSAAGFPLDC